MLLTINNMLGAQVMSLQTGRSLGQLDSPIVDPRNLKIVAFYVSGPMVDFSPAILFSEDIREFGSMGAIIDSSDDILSSDSLVRLNEIIDFRFELMGINVIDTNKHRLGRVENYTLNPDNFMIQQLYLKPTLMKSLSISHLTVSRSQITSIDNDKITVKVPTIQEKVTQKITQNLTPISENFENPFRKPKRAADQTESKSN
ncbi:MAG: hypothetical protein LBM09_00100 [Candidatus Nomurabacteria bacterium]|jgi:sporulation protein YlmC with PRC-barrel domain|nr:hypothetical protein [Candidatus Nomurabacteria bacterium]